MADAPNDATGHRDRLRERVLRRGADSLADYEIIEFLLMLALPRVDTKPAAKALIREFGSLANVLTADAESLMRVKGVGEKAAAGLKVVQVAALKMLMGQIVDRPVLANWQALIDYLHADMAQLKIERVRVLHLNAKNVLIRDEVMGEGSVDEAAIYIREVIRSAINLGSSALVLVHNHPSGDPAPSRADIHLTREIIEAGKRLKIAVHDHIIIGANGHASLRSLGLM